MSDADQPQPALEPVVSQPPPAPDQSPTGEAKEVEQHFGPRLERRRLDADLDTEIEAAMGGLSEKDLYGDAGKQGRQKETGDVEPGAPKKGKVVAVHGGDVFVNIPGARSQGVIALAQFPEGAPAVGGEIEVHVDRYDESNGLLLLTRKGAAVHANWSNVATGMTVEARVTATNKGGLSVDVNGIRGFMPVSQIDLYRVDNAEQFVNQKLKCLVAEANPQKRNLVVSRRALLEKEREEGRARVWAELAEGQVRSAIVRSVRDFGAFVDLGGVDALLHVSEMSWGRVADPSQIVQPGQTVQVVVLKIDRERRKVGVGLKQLQASPWDQAAQKYAANSVVTGRVTRLTDFGAFVELEPGVEGLVHVSELAPQRVRRPADVVQVGQEVQVLVLRVDAAQRKVSLSLKATQSKDAAAPPEAGPAEEQLRKATRPRTRPLRGGIGDE